MKLGIMQPYFMPYIGYFQLIKAVDKYVIYDDVNYIKGGWINRNSLLISGDKKLFTIALQDASPYKLICEIEIKDDFQKLLKTIHLNYCKAPYYRDTMTLMERIFAFSDKNLA
ncbi:MAG: WbqC family protein, partial [Alistipes sp.]